ncbi:transposase [Streptomyces sp. NPDC048312]|uniref:transposase n=1 Tax=Streptomyces sp. NPDC048312 TaxID=3155485 RepID=UPI003406B478
MTCTTTWLSTCTTTRWVLVVDETGDAKRGSRTIGVHRRYTSTARRESRTPSSPTGWRGHAAVDRKLYVPRLWTDQPDRRPGAGFDPDTAFVAKPFHEAAHRLSWFRRRRRRRPDPWPTTAAAGPQPRKDHNRPLERQLRRKEPDSGQE